MEKQLWREKAANFGSLFSGIDEENLRQFYGVLEQLRTNLDSVKKEGK